MQRYISILALFLCVSSTAQLLAGDENKPVDGKMLLGERTYTLTHAVAYEAKSSDEATVTLVMSDRKIAVETIKSVLRAGKGSDDKLYLSQPCLKIRLAPSGKPVRGNGSAESTFFGFFGDTLESDLKIEDGRIRGRVQLETTGEGALRRNFDIRLDLAVGLDGSAKPAAKPAGPAKPVVTGTFKGNGQPAKLTYVSARRGEPFGGKPTLVIVFTEKDHSGEKKPEVKAGFGDFGSAVVIKAYDDGQVVGCEVAHAAHDKKPFSSIGNVTTEAFEVGDGRVTGRISSGGEVKTFGQTWEVDITFTAPFSDAPSKAAADAAPPAKKWAKSQANEPAARPELKKMPAVALNVKDLPLPEDAASIDRKKLVKQIVCQSASPVQTVADELTKKLADQGWTRDGTDLVNAKSAILKRTLGEATLTIMVKAADKGSRVTIFTRGLDWEALQGSK
jgi:hypothetical protein